MSCVEGCNNWGINIWIEEYNMTCFCSFDSFPKNYKTGFIHIWCGAHQVNIVLKEVHTNFGNAKFYGNLIAAISYLCQHLNLILYMRCKSQKTAETFWESMVNVRMWFKIQNITIN